MKKVKWKIGIDEAGRGPIAGPVAIGLVAVSPNFDFKLVKDVRDSKKLTKLGRKEWFEKIVEWKKEGLCRYEVTLVNNRRIDSIGITKAVRSGVTRVLRKYPSDSEVFLDGLLAAPRRFSTQYTLVRGDETVPVISLASIIAKVLRDSYMEKLALKYPHYGFERHKGYGTKRHYKALRRHGTSDVHRTSFLGNLK